MRWYVTRELEFGDLCVIAEVVADPVMPGRPDERDERDERDDSLSTASMLASTDEIFSARELSATTEGEEALTAWLRRDDSSYEHDALLGLAVAAVEDLITLADEGDATAALLLREGSDSQRRAYLFEHAQRD
jgi:hypothetical protein